MTAPSFRTSELVARIYSTLPWAGPGESPKRFVYVGRAGTPRWIFPTDADVASALNSWSPYRLFSRIGWQAIRLAQAGRLTALLPGAGSFLLNGLPIVDWRRIGWKSARAPIPAIYIGTPGPRQKAVVHLIDPSSGCCEAVLKTPLRSRAREAIAHESDVLAVMEDEFFAAAPSLMFSDRPRGIATQQFLPGTSGCRHFLPEYQGLLRSLVLPDEHTTMAGQAVGWQSHAPWDSLDKHQVATLGAALAQQCDPSLLPACWVHGDFAPWNIRQAVGVAPRLIDWETGQRAGLPLQDAYHFLHMQQFLFHRSPQSFMAAVEPLARSMGISSLLARKLEIGYLARSFFSCLSGQPSPRADFLFKTLTIALQQQRNCVLSGSSSRLRLISSRSARQQEARSQMLALVTAELEREDIPYCILSGYEKAAAATGSDVDILVQPAAVDRFPAVLGRAARIAGAAIVQAIRHETSACYFVMARPDGKHMTHLAIDAYADYRRDNRTWLSAEPLIARRRRYRTFFRLGVADEFIYRLIKKILKQSLSAAQLKYLLHLFARDSTECQNRITQHWPLPLAARIEWALLRQDRAWFVDHLPELRKGLLQRPQLDGPLSRIKHSFLEGVRLISRVLQPTGYFIAIASETNPDSSELADRLMCNLATAFRRTEVIEPPATWWEAAIRALPMRLGRMRSTLIIETDDSGSGRGRYHWITRPDLIVQLLSTTEPGEVASAAKVVTLSADEFTDEIIRKATVIVLDRLAARTSMRLKLPCPRGQERQPQPEAGATELGFESVGSD